MAESRKSSRAKKTVDYTTHVDNDAEDDGDDFTEPTPPITKKPKEQKAKSKNMQKKKGEDQDNDCDEFKETSRGKRKERRLVEDRMFDRELELMLEMSRQGSSQETEDTEGENLTKKKAKAVDALVHTAPAATDDLPSEQALESDPSKLREVTDKENLPEPSALSSPVRADQEPAAMNAHKRPRPSDASNSGDLDVIESLDTSVEDAREGGKRSRRKAAVAAVAKQRGMADGEDDEDGIQGNRSKRRKKSDEDEDFDAGTALTMALDASDDEDGAPDDDDDDYGDEDFSGSSKSKKSKSSKGKKDSKKGEKKGNCKSSRKADNAKPAVGSAPPVKVSAPALVGRTPVGRGPLKGFTPPGQTSLSSSSLSTPGTKTTGGPGSPGTSLVAMKRPPPTPPTGSAGSNPLGGVRLVSPGQSIRLGLSKFARIKPLHGNAKV